jgi:hypothetical protein
MFTDIRFIRGTVLSVPLSGGDDMLTETTRRMDCGNGYGVTVTDNNDIDGLVLVTVTDGGNKEEATIALTPEQARALAGDLLSAADARDALVMPDEEAA